MNNSLIVNALVAVGVWCANEAQCVASQNYFPFEIQPVSTAPPQLLSQSANGPSFAPQVSADGQWIVFVSQADNLVTNNLDSSLTGAYLNIFIYGMTPRSVELVRVSQAGTGNGWPTAPPSAISINRTSLGLVSATCSWQTIPIPDANGLNRRLGIVRK